MRTVTVLAVFGVLVINSGCMTSLTQIRYFSDQPNEAILAIYPDLYVAILFFSYLAEPLPIVYGGTRTLLLCIPEGRVEEQAIMILDFPFCLVVDSILLPITVLEAACRMAKD